MSQRSVKINQGSGKMVWKKPHIKDPEARCGAHKKRGGVCKKGAGWGTSHPGIGKCKLHGGSTRNHIKGAAMQEAVQFYGAPKEINALDALMWVIRISAGEVEWLSDAISRIELVEQVEDTIVGKQVNLWVRERHDALERLAKYSKWAIDLGIAERAVKMQEMYGEMLYRLLQGIFNDLELTGPQREKAPEIIRANLVAIQSPDGVYRVEEDVA